MTHKALDPAEFWKDYEARLGEKVLGYCLGRYVGGWDRYPYPLWGLSIVTSAAYRFHHFPHEGWIEALARATTGAKAPEEKVIMIPRDKILGAAFRREQKLLRRIFLSAQPRLCLSYRREDGSAAELVVESDSGAKKLVELLSGPPPTPSEAPASGAAEQNPACSAMDSAGL
ncbi:MAG: hypothetical protein LBI85_04630 [Spirochaetaceae bacterium]|jgi:hypothetical protein|nr:hypothetical protein [Spirochaetaceae bacterium]